jgi:hypothetical protein
MADKVPVAAPKGKVTFIDSLMKPKWILTILVIVVIIIVIGATVFVSVKMGDSPYYPVNGIYTNTATDMILNASNLDGYRQMNSVTGNNSFAHSQITKGSPMSDYITITIDLEKYNLTENASNAFTEQRTSSSMGHQLSSLSYRDECFMYETSVSGHLLLTSILLRGNMILKVHVITNANVGLHDAFLKTIITAQLNKLADIHA